MTIQTDRQSGLLLLFSGWLVNTIQISASRAGTFRYGARQQGKDMAALSTRRLAMLAYSIKRMFTPIGQVRSKLHKARMMKLKSTRACLNGEHSEGQKRLTLRTLYHESRRK